MVDAVDEVVWPKGDVYCRQGDEAIDGHSLPRGVPDQAVNWGRAAVGAAVSFALSHYGQVFECEQAQKHSLDADLQEEVEQIQI